MGSVPCWGAKIKHTSEPINQNIKQKQYCNKFSKDLEKQMVQLKKKNLKKKTYFTQSILKEINPKYSLEGLKLRLQYFGHLMRRTDSLEKTLMLGKIEGRRRRGRQRMRWT